MPRNRENDLRRIVDILKRHGYEIVSAITDSKRSLLAYRGGDGIWERTARKGLSEGGWYRMQNHDCCRVPIEDANFCPHCGGGVNGVTAYWRGTTYPEYN